MAYKVFDFFAGCGGFSKGFELAGYEIVVANDVWEPAKETYEYNHKNTRFILKDIEELKPSEISDIYNGTPDVIIGGPPCQGFSLAGLRMIDDERNKLYREFVRMVNEFQPKMFVMENVPGLVKRAKGFFLKQILEDFKEIGYQVEYKILKAADFGVPQNRQRVFFVGSRNNEFPIHFPIETHFDPNANIDLFNSTLIKYVNLGDAISDLPLLDDPEYLGEEIQNYITEPRNYYQKLMRLNSDLVWNHIATNHSPKTREIINLVPEGKNYKALPEELRDTRKFNVAWTRLSSKEPSSTVDTGHRHHFHPWTNRIPTVRESARIQSFDDSFIFQGTKTSQYTQVGNAVPPILASAIARSVESSLNREELKRELHV
ncbi:DNA cytosine methyltransferase [Sporosarcina luteola]|uniref:DNA cytosine methyltransferase n=1 Tax=Sporosarcina luteola TaxID=582850 RepID=UPI00203F9606|nr:DNA cytosine methyltransferase [Sporosarcina luteola]MCM3638607.1 DNA cytosine methyltransferase [Sporosarcina luteola]